MAFKLEDMVVIGVENNDKAVEYLLNKDPCFGKLYEKNSRVCDRCRAPVILRGKVSLLNEVCKSLTEEEDLPVDVKSITSKEVQNKIQTGYSPVEIIHEIIQEDVSERAIKEARTLLARRIGYLKKKGLPMPEVPTVREILNGKEEESL